MNPKLKEKILESLSAVLPITGIVLLLSIFLVPLGTGAIVMFFVGAVLLIVGMGMFQLGAEMAMSPLGEGIGVQISKSKHLIFVALISLLMGVLITMAEPDLQVLSDQVPAVPNATLIFTVALGVGIFLAFAVLRIILKINLAYLLMGLYLVLIILSFFVPKDFLAVAFDSGGVTTGPITVPFIMAMGVGLSSVRADKDAANDSFGLVALSSIGPILSVLLLGCFFHPQDAAYSETAVPDVATMQDVMVSFAAQLPHYAREVLISIVPIAAMKKNQIPYLEIRGVDGVNIADLTKEKAREIRQRLDAEGLSVWSLGSPYGKISITEDFAPHLDLFKRGLELADILNAKHIRLFSFYVPAGEASAYRNAVMERLFAFLDAAAGSGILLCHENEKGIYGDTAPRCAEIHREFPDIRAVFDPANFVQCGQDTKEAWELLSPYVEYMHIKDALADGFVVPAGKGIGNIPFLLSNYRGKVLTLEPHLSVFSGFEKLEGEQASKMGKYTYPSSRAAFDAAAEALRECIK